MDIFFNLMKCKMTIFSKNTDIDVIMFLFTLQVLSLFLFLPWGHLAVHLASRVGQTRALRLCQGGRIQRHSHRLTGRDLSGG